MMSKLSTQGSTKNKPFKPKLIKVKGEDKVEVIMAKIGIKIDTDHTVEIDIEDNDIEVDPSIEKNIEKGLSIFKITE